MTIVHRQRKVAGNIKTQDIEIELVKLLEYGDDKNVLALTSTHKSLLRRMDYIKADAFNQKEILDLIGWGMIIPHDKNYKINSYGYYQLTPYGYAVSAYLKQRNKRKIKDHDMLAFTFARQKENGGLLPFLDVEFESSYGMCRPDVFVIKPTYNEANMRPLAYEVKVSRSDFLSDMAKPEKWKAYLDIADALYYICPEGLIDKKEMPKECGLIYYNKTLNSFDIKKQAKKYPKRITQPNMMRLILNTKKSSETILIHTPW